MSMSAKEMTMKKLIIAAAAVTLLGAPVTLAATPSSHSEPSGTKTGSHTVVDTRLSSECARLSQQFDQAEAAYKTEMNYTQALAVSTEGKTFCSSNKLAAGVQYLDSAIKMIGAKPNI
jgi:hypothetical protein